MPQQTVAPSELDDFFKAPAKSSVAAPADLDSFFGVAATPPNTINTGTLGKTIDVLSDVGNATLGKIGKTVIQAATQAPPRPPSAPMLVSPEHSIQSVQRKIDMGERRQIAKGTFESSLPRAENVAKVTVGPESLAPPAPSFLDPFIDLLPNLPASYKKLTTPEGQALGDAIRGLTTPENLAIMGGIAAANVIPGVGTAVDVGAAGYFAKQMTEAGIAAEADLQAAQEQARRARAKGDKAAAQEFDEKARYARAQKYINSTFAVLLAKGGGKKLAEAATAHIGETPRLTPEEVQRRVQRDVGPLPSPEVEVKPEVAATAEPPISVEEAKPETPTVAPEALDTFFSETKPPEETPTPESATASPGAKPEPAQEPPRESTVSTFLEDTTALKKHPARPKEATSGEEYKNFEGRVRAAGEASTPEEMADYIIKLRKAAELHAPDNPTIMEHIENAEEALQVGDAATAAWEAEQARGKGGLSSEYQRRVAEESYRKATGEEPPKAAAPVEEKPVVMKPGMFDKQPDVRVRRGPAEGEYAHGNFQSILKDPSLWDKGMDIDWGHGTFRAVPLGGERVSGDISGDIPPEVIPTVIDALKRHRGFDNPRVDPSDPAGMTVIWGEDTIRGDADNQGRQYGYKEDSIEEFKNRVAAEKTRREPIPPKRTRVTKKAAEADEAPKAPRAKKPPAESKPKTKAGTPERLIEDTAHMDAQAWAENARHAQEQLRPGESALTTESNAAGKEIEEEATAKAVRTFDRRSLKKGTPLEGFSEPPGVLAAAIEKRSGKLYDRIIDAFMKATEESHGEEIRAMHERTPAPEELLKAMERAARRIHGDDANAFTSPIPIGELRKEFPGISKAAFDKAVAALGDAEEVWLSKQDHPLPNPEEQAHEHVSANGEEYVAVSRRPNELEDLSFDFGENVVSKLDKWEAEQKDALKRLISGGTKDVVAFTAEAIARATAIGTIKVVKGIVKFSEWSAEMIRDFGEDIRPHLNSIYSQVNDRLAPLRELSKHEVGRLPAGVITELANTGNFSAVGKLLINMERASTKVGALKRAYREERVRRADVLQEVHAKQRGQAGHFEALGRLKGEMAADKKTFELPIQMEQGDVDSLFRQIQAHPSMRPFDKVSASDGLQKILTGRVPQKSQVALLREIFGPEFAESIPKPPFISKLRDLFTEVINIPRSIMASFDMSAALRQGVVFTTTKPVIAAGSFKEMFRQVFSTKNFHEWNVAARKDPMFPLMEESGLYMVDPTDSTLSSHEERFMSNLAERIPVIGAGVRASERAYVGFLNKMRFDVFKDLASKFIKEGIDPETQPAAYKSLAEFINNATGRGSLGKLERISQELNTVFFSPKLIAGRFHMLNPVWYMKQPKPVRMEAVKTMAQFVGTGMTILALAKAAGAQVETDPRSTDFGKIRFGNSRWDIWGGFQQWARATAQIISGYRKNTKGDIYKLSPTEFPFETRKDVAERFLASKLAPVPQLGYELLLGQKQFGGDITLTGEAAENAVPLYIQDVKDAVAELGPSAIISVGVPGFFGVGTQTYKEKPPTSAIHSTISQDLSDTATDVLMKSQVSVGRVERQQKDESAESLRLRSKVVATLLNEYIGDLAPLDMTEDADSRHVTVKKTEEKARRRAAEVFARTKQMDDQERMAYLREWLSNR